MACFYAQKWPALINSLWENGCRQRKTVFRYEKSMKFANISGGFGGALNFELIENFPGVDPLLNFQNFEAALRGSRATQDDETWYADSRGRGC